MYKPLNYSVMRNENKNTKEQQMKDFNEMTRAEYIKTRKEIAAVLNACSAKHPGHAITNSKLELERVTYSNEEFIKLGSKGVVYQSNGVNVNKYYSYVEEQYVDENGDYDYSKWKLIETDLAKELNKEIK